MLFFMGSNLVGFKVFRIPGIFGELITLYLNYIAKYIEVPTEYSVFDRNHLNSRSSGWIFCSKLQAPSSECQFIVASCGEQSFPSIIHSLNIQACRISGFPWINMVKLSSNIPFIDLNSNNFTFHKLGH